jgi:type I restriction enzyme S subunit
MGEWLGSTLGLLEAESRGVIQTGPFGSQLHMSDYSDSGTPVVMPTNIRDLRIDPTGIARVSDEHVARLARHRLKAGDIVYSRRGDVEKCALVTDAESGWLCGTGCLLVRVGGSNLDPRFLAYSLSQQATRKWIRQHAVGATMPNLNTEILREVPVEVPSLAVQRAIAATLGALDDKIESNSRQRSLLRQLGASLLAQAVAVAHSEQPLANVTASIARGVAPKYADDDPTAPLVVNQKCIRGGWVSLAPARRMRDREVPPARIASDGDILVNSTGTGTLGRTARWHEGQVFVDGHVSVVKPDLSKTDPTVLAYSLLGRDEEVEALATGSTGQTELSPGRLGDLTVRLPAGPLSRDLEPRLIAIERRAHQLADESDRLAALRDSILPGLLSGKIRVPVEASAT